MKNAMKRLMTLALVAVMLISVFPMAASAAEKITVTYAIKVNDSPDVVKSGSVELNPKEYDVKTMYEKILANAGMTGEFKRMAWVGNGSGTEDLTATFDATQIQKASEGNYDFSLRITTAPQTGDGNNGGGDTGDGNNGGGNPITTVPEIVVDLKLDGNSTIVKTFTKAPSDEVSAKVSDLLTWGWKKDWKEDYSFDHAWCATCRADKTADDRILAGHNVSIMLNTKPTEPTPTEPKPENKPETKPVGGDRDVVNGELYMAYTGNVNKDPYSVVLNVYTKNSGNGITYSEDFTITTLATEDTELTITEVRNFLKNYYKSTSTTDGFSVDGIYEYEENFNMKWSTDTQKYSVIHNINKARYDKTIRLAVVLTNAKLKTASNADPSNPKTGDNIYMAVAVMALSGTALAAAYVYNKKRIAC